MLFSEAKGRKVVSTSTAQTVGKIATFVIDPATATVVAVVLKKSVVDGHTLQWSDITGFGADAVTINGPELLVTAEGHLAELAGKASAVLGKRVLTESGNEIGEVRDVDFDGIDGSVRALVLASAEVAGTRLIGVGSYAVVVRNA